MAVTSGTWSDNAIEAVSLAASVGTVVQNTDSTWSWSYPTARSQTVTITATDSDGFSTFVTFALNVLNAPPVVTADASSVAVDEGSQASMSGTWSDPVTLSASVGTVVQNGDGTWTWSITTTDGPDDSQTVTITATDSEGASSSVSFDLTVNNAPPAVARGFGERDRDRGQRGFRDRHVVRSGRRRCDSDRPPWAPSSGTPTAPGTGATRRPGQGRRS